MDTAMEFEMTMNLLFGKEAYQIAGTHGNAKSRAKWMRKMVRELTRNIDKLDTTDRHKQMLMGELESIASHSGPSPAPSWLLIYSFVRLVARLLGYDFLLGAKCHSVTYWQNLEQSMTSAVASGGDVMQDYYDKQNVIAERLKVVRELKGRGLSDFKIGVVLNMSEYQVKKLHSAGKDV